MRRARPPPLPSSGGIGCRRSTPNIWGPRPSASRIRRPAAVLEPNTQGNGGPRPHSPGGGPSLGGCSARASRPFASRVERAGCEQREMRKGPDSPGLRHVRSCWGTWTRTKNNGTRNRRVANYTIPQWPATEAPRRHATLAYAPHADQTETTSAGGPESRASRGSRRAGRCGRASRSCRGSASTRTAAATRGDPRSRCARGRTPRAASARGRR